MPAMKTHFTIYLHGATPVQFKDKRAEPMPGKRYFRGTMKRIGLVKPERRKPGLYNPVYPHSVN